MPDVLRAGDRRPQEIVVLQLYTRANRLLPWVLAASLGLDASTRLQTVAESDQLSRDGAVCAVSLGRLEEAVVFLEAGRGIFWSQALHLRAAELDSVPENERHELKKMFGMLQSNSSIIGDATLLVEDLERAVIERRQLNEEAEALITKIRTYPELERFLLPPAFNSLMASLPPGLVVILNSSNLGSHALLLNGATGLANILVVSDPASDSDIGIVRFEKRLTGRAMVSGKRAETLEDKLGRLWVLLVRPIFIRFGLMVGALFFSSDERPCQLTRLSRKPTQMLGRACGGAQQATMGSCPSTQQVTTSQVSIGNAHRIMSFRRTRHRCPR
jgi:hypothetical protein